MIDFQKLLSDVCADNRYQRNLDWGFARPGHPEGTIRAHIADLESNLDQLRHRFGDAEYWMLKVLIHVHDTSKADAHPDVAIADPRSHASLARVFLAEYCDHADLLATVQYHDEPFALYRQYLSKGQYSQERMNRLLNAIRNWDLFLAFNIIDGCTAGKTREPLEWWFAEVAGRVPSAVTAADILR